MKSASQQSVYNTSWVRTAPVSSAATIYNLLHVMSGKGDFLASVKLKGWEGSDDVRQSAVSVQYQLGADRACLLSCYYLQSTARNVGKGRLPGFCQGQGLQELSGVSRQPLVQ
ncbi:hypothetical protein J6590_049388 [Homalodisca vitripennis]|nr:hypothetical protein J6590_049388 [Homalodisca vitripennis]